MKRNTNLFYSSGPDSKFLTFSNYTESLTGNFLSTDTKIYPSTFLCLNIPSLINIENKKEFINKYLIGYYENKLAFLRDYCIENNKKPEDYILPLAYLLDAIIAYINKNEDNINENNLITYFGDITEQDYNGTYTDTICIVDFAKNYYIDNINKIENTIETGYSYNEALNNQLYGWDNDVLENTEYSNLQAYFDKDLNLMSEDKQYQFSSNLNILNINKEDQRNEIKFNIVIPLFDLTNINYKSLQYINDNIYVENPEINLQYNDNYKPSQKYVPLGIWFSDSEIILTKDINTGFSHTWSLVISSQFKPFPYSNEKINSIDDTTNSNAFPTFAMILNKQNKLLEEFSKLTSIINEQNIEIKKLKQELANKSTENNIDKLTKDLINFKYELTNKFNSFKQDVTKTLDNLTWNTTK